MECHKNAHKLTSNYDTVASPWKVTINGFIHVVLELIVGLALPVRAIGNIRLGVCRQTHLQIGEPRPITNFSALKGSLRKSSKMRNKGKSTKNFHIETCRRDHFKTLLGSLQEQTVVAVDLLNQVGKAGST
jgi:hypothetical protein